MRMMVKVAYLCALIALALSPLPLTAAPSAGITYLMSEPMSLFEWSMLRLDQRLDNLCATWPADLDLISATSNVDYDWDRNRVIMEFIVYPRYISLGARPARELCSQLTGRVKGHFGVGNGPDLVFSLEPGIGRLFDHMFFESKNRPLNLADEVNGLAVIRIQVWASPKDEPMFLPIITSESSLMGEDVLWLDKP